MYRVTVRDRVMIAHSFRGEVFGLAQQLHGATYVVEAEFARSELDEHGLVVDIGLAHAALSEVLSAFAFRNLDDMPDFEGINTTTEFLAGEIARRIVGQIRAGKLGTSKLDGLTVVLRESDVAWASFSLDL
ncbi:MAG: 6-carboxytetrahydropterin synthase [Myxococcales bacterium]|nr:6-carboxytetrahydropterin synthase [Myxococcales bacterium]